MPLNTRLDGWVSEGWREPSLRLDFKMLCVQIAVVGRGTSGEPQAVEHPLPGQQPPGEAQAQAQARGILGGQ